MPRSGKTDRFAKQDDVYTVCLRGQQDGKVYKENRVITSVQTVISARDEYDAFMALAHEDSLEFVVSNTTEAGITFDEKGCFYSLPAVDFPGKIDQVPL